MKNDVSKVIDCTDLVENILNQIIHKYTAPRKEVYEFIWNVLLDSSVMPLGSKVKVVMAISQNLEGKLNSNSLHEVVSFRNAFAHHGLGSHPTLLVGKTPDEDESACMLQILSQSGKIRRIRREEALKEFSSHFENAKESLIELLEKVKNESK